MITGAELHDHDQDRAGAVRERSGGGDTLRTVHLALIKYTVMRLVLFVVVLIVLGLIMGRSVMWLFLSAVISLALSYLFLRKPREQLAVALTERTGRRLDRKAAEREAGRLSDDELEDQEAEALRAKES